MFKITKLLFFLIIGLLTQCTTEKAQNDVLFLGKTPIIDGKLDEELSYLPSKEFNHIWQFDNPVTDTVKVTYKIAYTPTHLYLYIETDVDSVSYHRRGSLWGDGYRLMLAIPQADSLTNEYYELYFSPTKDKDYQWAKQRIATYNFDQRHTKKLSKKTRSQEKAQTEKSGFEALIAWTDIEPYHPWFLNQIGYNLYFAKGIESVEHGYFTNGYAVVEDEGIWDEEISKRNYQLLSFEIPKSSEEGVVLIKPKKRNLKIREPLILKIATIGKKTEKLKFSVLDTASSVVYKTAIDIESDGDFQQDEMSLNVGELPIGKYVLNIEEHKSGSSSTYEVVVHPTIDFNRIEDKIKTNEHQLKIGTVNTLLFKLNQIKDLLTKLKPYETGLDIVSDWNTFQKDYQLFNQGTPPYKEKRKPYRRAFKSKYDSTYQPYTIKLPENFDPQKKYPLLVFLHGSGQDEQGLLNAPRSNGKFIELAPFARDKFKAYTEDYSQKDIIEAIEDVKLHFPIDEKNIIIGGFSMGGYGALRTYYESPKRYKGVAVFAGHPNLANEWLDGNYPNFLNDNYLAPFKSIPVFIYHGKKDAALDVKLIEQMSAKLSGVGAIVTKSIVEDQGHEYQDKKTNKMYFDWLEKITK